MWPSTVSTPLVPYDFMNRDPHSCNPAFVDPYSWEGREKGKKEGFLKPASPQFKAQWSSTPFPPMTTFIWPNFSLVGLTNVVN